MIGFAAAACETLGVAIVSYTSLPQKIDSGLTSNKASDLYFLHERGSMVSLYA
jgi:hypothetical protein